MGLWIDVNRQYRQRTLPSLLNIFIFRCTIYVIFGLFIRHFPSASLYVRHFSAHLLRLKRSLSYMHVSHQLHLSSQLNESHARFNHDHSQSQSLPLQRKLRLKRSNINTGGILALQITLVNTFTRFTSVSLIVSRRHSFDPKDLFTLK